LRIAAFLLAIVNALAHDAPAHVTVQLQARIEGKTMRVYARIPLEAVRDVDFPAIEGGYLDIAKLAPQLSGLAKTWVADPLELHENGRRVAAPRVVGTQISIASDKSFATFEQAAAHLREPLPGNAERLFWKQVFFDVALEFPIAYAGLGEQVQTVLHYRDQALLLPGDQDLFPLDPGWMQSARLFVRMGFLHILSGCDHLLFLLCLVIPMPKFRSQVAVVTAFTVAHSITLMASALNMAPDALWFPPLVELLIAVSILFMALANIFQATSHSTMLAFAFGLVHGFGFSFALRESLQFAGSHLIAALFAFNVGVELGQLAALAIMVPAVAMLYRFLIETRVAAIVFSSLAAHTAWHWMLERWDTLAKYAAPSWNAAMILRLVLFFMGAWALVWTLRRVRGRLMR
jgi:hypothetical protein